MSALPRCFHHIPAARRSYSFFSSKPGGGRYFNSSKPPKSPVVTAKSKSDPSSPDTGSKDPSTKASSASTNASSNNVSSTPNSKTSSAASPESSHGAAAQRFRNGAAPFPQTHLSGPCYNYTTIQPAVSQKDFKIHQFFCLHRPLLLISNPPSIFSPAPANAPLLRSSVTATQAGSEATEQLPEPPFMNVNLDGTFPTGHATGVDGDAEAARQLHHAMTVSRIGPIVSWEDTLRRLGLDVSKDAERVHLQEQLDREWEEVMLDSVKRKRRKKMKKHKLKKRRRATRAQRMRIGR